MYSEWVANSYDTVRYPSYPFPQTHPDRLATLAILFGMRPAPAGACRVLEIGCASGGNLIPMAWSLPESRFLGIDLAATAIEEASAAAAELGLRNIEFRHLDLTDAGTLGPFDYLIAHGVYSWVPPEVRVKLLSVCRSCMAPQGVAYLSSNTYPGGYLRRMLRDAFRFHNRGIRDVQKRIRRTYEFAQYAAHWKDPVRGLPGEAANEFASILDRAAGSVFHDELAEVNDPVYFHEFMDSAENHGLQFLAEADFFEMAAPPGDPEREAAAGLPPAVEVISREQYHAFFRFRRFRQTLLCHKEIGLDRSMPPRVFQPLLAASASKPSSAKPDLTAGAVEKFVNAKGATASTDLPAAKALLVVLGERWPMPVPFGRLPDLVRARLNGAAGPRGEAYPAVEPEELARMLIEFYRANFIE